MSIKVYWGKPGSYKTYSAVNNEVIDSVLEGKNVLTNIRGLNLDAIYEKFGDDSEKENRPENQYIRFIESVVGEELIEAMRFFFIWLPRNTIVVLDEARVFFPKDLKLSNYTRDKFKLSDFPNLDFIKEDLLKHSEFNFIDEEIESRPSNLSTALDMHRHYNWDFVFTLPDIKQLSPHVRGICEGAFHCKNQARTLGALGKGKFTVHFHDADNNGNASNVFSIETYRANLDVFECYQSTATGQHNDTLAGKNALPFKFYALSFLLLCIIIYLIFFSDFSIFIAFFTGGVADYVTSDQEVVALDNEDTVNDTESNSTKTGNVSSGDLANSSSDKTNDVNKDTENDTEKDTRQYKKSPIPFLSHPLYGSKILFSGNTARIGKKRYFFITIIMPDGSVIDSHSSTWLNKLGYVIAINSKCSYTLLYRGEILGIYGCASNDYRERLIRQAQGLDKRREVEKRTVDTVDSITGF